MVAWWEPEGLDGMSTGLRRMRLLETDDSGTQQLMRFKGLKEEELKKVVRILPHGFTSVPPKDSEGVVYSLGGRSDRAMVLGVEHKDKRPKNTPEGGTIIYDADGNIASIVKQKIRIVHSDEVRIEAKKIILKGDVYLGDDSASKPVEMQGDNYADVGGKRVLAVPGSAAD